MSIKWVIVEPGTKHLTIGLGSGPDGTVQTMENWCCLVCLFAAISHVAVAVDRVFVRLSGLDSRWTSGNLLGVQCQSAVSLDQGLLQI